MSEEKRKKIKEIFLTVLPDVPAEQFEFERERNDFENWDSFSHMQLISELESAFDINFEMDEIAEINKPEDIVLLIEKKTSE